MNRTLVVKAIKQCRDAGNELHPNYRALTEALEEIASENNIEVLRRAISWMSGQVGDKTATDLALIRGMMVSVQVPKESVYAYPVTLQRHFDHYCEAYVKCAPVTIPVKYWSKETDDFGCGWQRFTGPKELVDFLRENNVPIKVCE